MPGRAWIAAATAAGATVFVAATPLDRSDLVDRLHGLFAGTGYVALAATPLLASPYLLRSGRRTLGVAGLFSGSLSAVALVVSLTAPSTGAFQRLGLTATDGWIVAAATTMLLGWRWPSGLTGPPIGQPCVMIERDTSTDAELVARARANIARAYSPYSKFKTGAIVVNDDGSHVDGTIVENVSLGLAMCAERVALFNAVTSGSTPVALVLAAPATDGSLTWPCGACLQVALELGGPDLTVVVGDDDDGPARRAVLSDLLPRGPYVER